MNANFTISGATKAEKYETLLPLLKGLVADEPNWIGVLANSAAALRQAMDFFWVGYYLADFFMAHYGISSSTAGDTAVQQTSSETLLLGPFQGDIACYNIKKGCGVCGTALQQGTTLIVRNVEDFPGHIACSSLSRSEIVVPLKCRETVIGVLDIDSDQLASFDDIDRQYLEKVAQIIAQAIGQ